MRLKRSEALPGSNFVKNTAITLAIILQLYSVHGQQVERLAEGNAGQGEQVAYFKFRAAVKGLASDFVKTGIVKIDLHFAHHIFVGGAADLLKSGAVSRLCPFQAARIRLIADSFSDPFNLQFLRFLRFFVTIF